MVVTILQKPFKLAQSVSVLECQEHLANAAQCFLPHIPDDKAVIEIAIENALGGNANFINWYEAGGYPATYMKMI
jgi:hypothetical protein